MTNGQLNILRVYNQATADELDAGLRWYASAHEEIVRSFPELDPTAACGIVAATSPQTAWDRNLIVARMVLDSECRSGSTRDRLAVCRAILDGSDPWLVVKGPKTSAFFACLAYPRVSQEPCIDGHAWAIWRGVRVATSKVKVKLADLRAAQADYAAVADAMGLKPHQVQAITWLAWRRLHPLPGPHQLVRAKALAARTATPSAN